jgi:hypothetical protein
MLLLLSWGLVLGAWLLAPVGAAMPTRQAPPDRTVNQRGRQQVLARLRTGQTQDEVRALLGPPGRIARQILHHRYLEQWVYEGPWQVRLEFDCPRGRKPLLTTVQELLATRS